MNRRDAMRAVGGAVAALSATSFAQTAKAAAPAAAKAEPLNTALIDSAEACAKASRDCLAHCIRLLSTGDTSMAECAHTVQQTLALCSAMAQLARVSSAHVKALAALCAKACRECEAACKKHENHHAECKACMEACGACAAECEKLAAAAKH